MGASSWISLFPLSRHDRHLVSNHDEVSFKLFLMLRLGTLLMIAATALSGCSIDADSLKNCKDKEGNPLPEWVCRKDSGEKSN